jgi:glycine cleavage system H protein
MTVLLILLTLIIFLAADYFVQRSKARAEARVPVRDAAGAFPAVLGLAPYVPEDIALAYNHTWLRTDPDGTHTLGLDGLLARLVGSVEQLILPRVGAVVAPSANAISVRHGTGGLVLSSPVRGRIVGVNSEVLSNPRLATSDPYGKGWLVKIEPMRENDRTQAFIVPKAKEWMRQQSEMIKEFFATRTPAGVLATMQDGGIPVEGLLKNYGPDVWEEFNASFASLNTRQSE